MGIIIRWLGLIVLAVLLAGIHIASSFVLPPPWSNLNIVVAMTVLLTFEWTSTLILGFSLLIYFLIELYSATYFGVILAAGVSSSFLIYWLYGFMFTNHSWYSALVLGAIAVASYRLVYIIGFIFTELFSGHSDLPLAALLSAYAWELIFTSLLSSILISFRSRQFTRLSQLRRVG